MKAVTLIHNPNAGNEKHTKRKLISLIEANGYKCRYLSTTNKGWKKFNSNTDLIIAAGGDGTVRRVVKEILKKDLEKSIPIALLPLGTANNIKKALKISGTTEEIIASWKKAKPKKYDVGIIKGIQKTDFFLEAFGLGLFPYLLENLEKVENKSSKTPQEEKQEALHALHRYIYEYTPLRCKIKIDNIDYSGEYLMVVIMNTNSLGPNLFLAPAAKVGDGHLNVVLITEENKEHLAKYVLKKIKNENATFPIHSIKAKKVSLAWKGMHAHADDEQINSSHSKKIKIKIKKRLLKFLV